MTVKLPPQRQRERTWTAVADWITIDTDHRLHDLARGCDKGFARRPGFRHRERPLLEREADGAKFRLLGVGLSALTTADHADPADFVDSRAAEAEHAVDRVRARFGDDALIRGLVFERPEER